MLPRGTEDSLSDRIYAEQVRSLYLSLAPATAMLAAFGLTFWLAYRATPDTFLLMLGLAGIVASSSRIVLTAYWRDTALTAALPIRQARRLEALFSVPYVLFALILGLLGFHVFRLAPPEIHMLAICVIVGYCAGTATNCGLRPRLAITSMLLAVGPSILVSLFKSDPPYIAMAFIASAFVLSAIQSILTRFKVSKAEIGGRLVSVSLARRDTLTTLPNRLALQEYYDERAALISPNQALAVHYLDLDGFKPVNDEYGHAAGDALLQIVADRLRGAVRSGDIVARMGGDEFAVIQFGLHHADEATLLARRIVAAIEQPFIVEQRSLAISASVGTAISHDRDQDLDSLLKAADTRLYEVKQSRRPSRLLAMTA